MNSKHPHLTRPGWFYYCSSCNRCTLITTPVKKSCATGFIGYRTSGGQGTNGSGDIFIAFSTANPTAFQRANFIKVESLPNDEINPLFEATIQATEEAIINAMVAAETMVGINGNKSYALPHKLVIDVLKKYNRIK
jgi:L-aminopeptidase/D-esterase-like protein